MKRFLVNCRNHRGRTRDVAITAASEAEAVAYLRQKGFTDCVARGAVPGKASDDATTAVPVLPDPDAPADPAPASRARSFSHQARRQGGKAEGGVAERAPERRSTAETAARREPPAEDAPWWATAGGVVRRAWQETRRLAGAAWIRTRTGCARGWARIATMARKASKRGHPSDESPAP